jgi:putative chitinase
MPISRAQLIAIMPNAVTVADQFLKPVNDAMARYDIVTPQRQAAFLAQLAHESMELRRTQENLNYSWERLRKIFPKYFRSDVEAQAYDRQRERIGNRVYANRLLNGDEASGDGWRFRGRGPIQVTGRENYRKAGQALGINLESEPDRLLDPATGCLAAAWFWYSRGLNSLADGDNENGFREITRRVNGAHTGLEERAAFWEKARSVLGLPHLGPLMMMRMPASRGVQEDARDDDAELLAQVSAAPPRRATKRKAAVAAARKRPKTKRVARVAAKHARPPVRRAASKPRARVKPKAKRKAAARRRRR